MIWSKSSSSKGLTCFEAMSDRSEYDRRYAIDASKLCGEFGWRSMHNDFEADMREAIV